MDAYTGFAYVYDKFMQDIPYKAWADFITETWGKYGLKPESVLDLACGTGNITTELAKTGCDCIGIDLSEDMLGIASEKAAQEGLGILFLNQSMTDFELYGTVQAVVCMCDSINYLLKKSDLVKMFSLAANYTEPHGLFIFDMLTIYKFENVIANNCFAETAKNAAYIMQSSYDFKKRINRYGLTLFEKQGRSYARFDELHVQRAHSEDEIRIVAEKSGFRVRSVIDADTLAEPSDTTERLFFVCERGEEHANKRVE